MNIKLTQLPNLIPRINLKTSRILSSKENEVPYVFDIASITNICVASTSDQEFFWWNYNNDSLGKFSYHTDTITKLKIHKNHLLISSSKDGCIAIWDLRASKVEPAQILLAPNREPLLSFDINSSDTILAAGTELVEKTEIDEIETDEIDENDAKIFFWDLRNASSIEAQFIKSHSDDITQIQFHPNCSSRFISGSVDGLICSFDIKNFNEDEELVGVINSGSSINKAGYFGSNGEYVYCLTHTETFSIWGSSEGDMLNNLGDIRQDSSDSIAQIDYAIDCQFDYSTNRLFLFAGSYTGEVNVLHVDVNNLQLCQTLCGGHSEIVRSVFWNPQTNLFLTGGEDAKLCLWGP